MSRFRTRAGVYLYGKMRRTDFLPVGGNESDEQVKRGYLSESTDSDEKGRYDMCSTGESSEEEGKLGGMAPASSGRLGTPTAATFLYPPTGTFDVVPAAGSESPHY